MSSSVSDPPVGSVHPEAIALLEQFDSVLDRLQALDLTALTEDATIEVLRRQVRCERRVPSVRHALVAEVEARAIPATKRCRTTGAFLRTLLNVSNGEGAQWARDARELVGKRSLSTGEELPPPLPEVAAAVKDGGISTVHAQLIADTIVRETPAAVSYETRARGEARLVRTARVSDPARLARACQDFLDRVDPDGSLGTDHERAHKRDLTIGRQGRDGMYPVRGRLDPETGALINAAISPLSAPQPSKTQPDLRTAGQRRHDAIAEIARRALAGGLPTRHGLPGTMLVTVALTDLERRTGLASTFHGGRLSVRDLLRMAADLKVIPVVMDCDGQVLHFGEEQRLATTAQRLALAVTDQGCTYPDCDVPAVWSQSAHGEPFATSRRTGIDDLALLCGYHHRVLDNQQWTIQRIKGRIWLIPPPWVDPDRRPRTNEYFKRLDEGVG